MKARRVPILLLMLTLLMLVLPFIPPVHANGGFSNGGLLHGNASGTITVSANTGDLILVLFGHSACSQQSSTPTDTIGNTYTYIGSATTNCQNKGSDYYYTKSTGTSASDAVSITCPSCTVAWDAFVAVYSGTTGVIGSSVLTGFNVGSSNIADSITVSANAYIIGISYTGCVDSVTGMSQDWFWNTGGVFGNGQGLSVQKISSGSYTFTYPDSCGDQGTWSVFEFTATSVGVPSTTTVSCAPNEVSTSGGTSTCTATVIGNVITPTGTITWSVSVGPGSVSPITCTISGGSGSAKCTTSFSSNIAATSTVKGIYGGDVNYQTSTGTGQVTASTPLAYAAAGLLIILFGFILLWLILSSRNGGGGRYRRRQRHG